MKRLLVTFGFLALLLAPTVAVAGHAAAVDIFSNCGSGSAAGSPDVCGAVNGQGANNGTNNPIVNIIKAAIDVISYIVGAAAIIGLVVSGFRMITANGDANAVASARTGFVYSLVGIAVTALAQVIVIFVVSKIK